MGLEKLKDLGRCGVVCFGNYYKFFFHRRACFLGTQPCLKARVKFCKGLLESQSFLL